MGKTKRSSIDRESKTTETAARATASLRLQELIREEVNLILRNEVRDPRLDGVVITMVELAGEARARGSGSPPKETKTSERRASTSRGFCARSSRRA